MTTSEPVKTTPASPATPPPPPPPAEAREGGSDRFNILAAMLKTPQDAARRIASGRGLPLQSAVLLGWGLLFHAVYGFAMGLFGGMDAALMSAVKTPVIALYSVLLCLPSLYVFSCVGGMPLRMSQALALAGSAVAVTGLLLIGLTPVTWLFAVSTNSLGFVVVLNVIAWLLAVSFASRFFSQLRTAGGLGKTGGLRWWLVIYIIVTLQMTTTMRPLMEKRPGVWRETDKKFFLVHFGESFRRAK
jgi:hypothetical protein